MRFDLISDEISRGLKCNRCRFTGYIDIVKAATRSADLLCGRK